MSLHLNIDIVTMQSALQIRTLLIILTHIWLSVTVMRASPHSGIPADSLQEKADPALELADASLEAAGEQLEKNTLPLAKVAHSNVMDLLQRFFVATPIHTPSYTPFLQQFGVRINWLALLYNFWPGGQKRYEGGVDLDFSGPIQLSIDLGYATYQPKDIACGNQLKYKSKGRYGVAALLYVIAFNQLTNAYFGIAYGQSRFDLITFCNGQIPAKPFVAGWIQFVGGSELRLLPQIYGGMQFGLAHLLHCKENNDDRLSNYFIPGYGRIVNKITFDMTFYLKWSISFLEKKIVI
ncbi:MAG: DUF6048 family protein [Candidatus Cardinium sp.]|uniref:DUF6048 family protein n=1 Tax=Cardinium endosymbiont of Dermatophagoides farinae TaxID=2597823 RepID=UPI001181E162|nr:DUF6048 family protein [Cardinium endosymbiont of Dermatophagoides farinae]TSJ80502.1 hypothetical protein FPG78_00085 [Cardinium endosymbiont of Dermatophagoides farinae]UWW96465.1 MAG: DUF6048 family protein [Candidatus Cardinium sp.]